MGISLSLLVQKLSLRAENADVKPVLLYEGQADNILLNTRFAYAPELGCRWHRQVGLS